MVEQLAELSTGGGRGRHAAEARSTPASRMD